jgi:hypothetical protein
VQKSWKRSTRADLKEGRLSDERKKVLLDEMKKGGAQIWKGKRTYATVG